MPTYLIHGFRWSRPLIRVYIATHDLDDCAAEWIIQPASALALLNSFYTLFDFIPACQQPTNSTVTTPTTPTTVTTTTKLPGSVSHALADPPKLTGFNAWSTVKLLEQHSDARPVGSQPFAYVGDYVVPVALGADIGAEMAAYETRRREHAERVAAEAAAAAAPTPTPTGPPVSLNNAAAGPGANRLRSRMSVSELRRAERQVDWIEKLRDRLQAGAGVGWYVVVCDDGERDVGGEEEGVGEESAEGEVGGLRKKASLVRLRGLFGRREREGERETEKEREEGERPISAGGRKISKARRPL